MLKTKIFRVLAALVIIFGLISAFFGMRIITERVIGEAQTQVSVDLNTAWEIINAKKGELRTILTLVAIKKAVVDATAEQAWSSPDLRHRLEVIQRTFNLDFMGVVSSEGDVVVRCSQTNGTGDYKVHDPAITRALKGEAAFGVMLLSKDELMRECEGLEQRAFLQFEPTDRARSTSKQMETRGMVMMGAVPIFKGPQVMGVLYAGVLLNRNHDLVDRITEVVYRKEMYNGVPMGTATLFLDDCRIATSVRLPNGNRALGTRVSKEVADRVLDNGLSWLGPAFVVKQSYLSAYDPIRDLDGRIIGMLYVGRLEQPFHDLTSSIMWRYAGLMIAGLVAALILAFMLAGRVANPVHTLVLAAQKINRGEQHVPVPPPIHGSCDEVHKLVVAFNEMARSLGEREASLREANGKLADANKSLKGLNQSYMDMLGFVSHELKSPVASIMNYAFLLQQNKIGSLNEMQAKAAANIETNCKRIVEMVRHYLNLSRIETGELTPVPTRVNVAEEVISPILQGFERDLALRSMKVDTAVDANTVLFSDLNMTHEVFENLVSNAIKYGKDGGNIQIAARPSGTMIEFSVRNEGPGIPLDKLDTLFQKFTRLEDGQLVRKQKGTGLGLFITRHIIEAHKGSVHATSQPGEWAEFRFTLPTYKQEKN